MLLSNLPIGQALYKFGHLRHNPAMLRYMAIGTRRFGLYPMYIHQRDNWEFFAVLRGKCGALFTEAEQPAIQQHHLWVFPPEVPHGWRGEGAGSCKIAVFHFGKVPPLLENAARKRVSLECALAPNQVRRIEEIHTELRVSYGSVTEKSLMFFEKALLELSLIALSETPFTPDQNGIDYPLEKIHDCLAWYNDHMAEQPKLDQIAQAVSVSVRHLRRLFWQVRREGPQTAFTRLRLERAMGLLSLSNLKLDAIARQCGFSSSSDFCRVFKLHHHMAPDAWRKKHLPAYEEPPATRK
jgi:AraC family transcriptional regulator